MTKNVYTIGFLMYILIMIAFFITNIFFRNENYYRNSIVLSSFLLPFVFAIGAFYSVFVYKKTKGELSFGEAFGRAFLPMFIGGFLSISSMFVYINYINLPTKNVLNNQYIESYKQALEEEYHKAKQIVKPHSPEMQELEKKYAEGKMRIQKKEEKKEDMFTIYYFGYVFAGYTLFFIILSVFFGSFFRTKANA